MSSGLCLGQVSAIASSWGNDASVYMVVANHMHHCPGPYVNLALIQFFVFDWRLKYGPLVFVRYIMGMY